MAFCWALQTDIVLWSVCFECCIIKAWLQCSSSRELLLRWLWNGTAEVLPLFYHFSHTSLTPRKFFHPAQSPRMWLCLPGGLGQGHSSQPRALPLPLVLTPLGEGSASPCTGEMIWDTWKMSFRPCLVLFMVHSLYFCCFFHSLKHTSLLSGVNPAPASEMSNSCPKVYKF